LLLAPRWKKVIRDLLGSPLRTLLVVLAIAVGVFMFGVVATAGEVLNRELNKVYMATNPASITMSVSPFGDELVQAVEAMRAVSAAEGRAVTTVSMELSPQEWISLHLYAVDFDEMAISTFSPEQGRWPPERREVLLERSILDLPNYQPGDTIHIETQDGVERSLITAGLTHDISKMPTAYFQEAYGYITLDTLEWIGGSRAYNELYILVHDADDREAIEAISEDIEDRIERYGYSVYEKNIPEPGVHWNAYSYDALTLIMGVLAVFSLFLSAFLVINTISAILKQQVRQIGMMKAVGAVGRQVTGIYLVTVLVFGLLSLVAAIPASTWFARVFLDYSAALTNYEIQSYRTGPWIVGVQGLLAVLLPLAAGSIPIVLGARTTVREAVSDYGIEQTALKRDAIDRLAERVRGLPRPLLLSLRNTFRRKGRAAITILMLSLVGAIFISVFSVRESLSYAIEKIGGLFEYDAGIYLTGPTQARFVEQQAGRVPGVLDVEGWVMTSATRVRPDGTDGAEVIIEAPPPDSPYIDAPLVEGRWPTAGGNELAVMENFLQAEPDLALGDEVVMDIEGCEETFTIVGVIDPISDPERPNGFGYIMLDTYERITGQYGMVNYVVISTEGHDIGSQRRVLRDVEEHLKRAGIGISESVAVETIMAAASIAMQVLMLLLLSIAALLAAVGGLGLTATMSLNVIERTREIGVMRALGASNGAVWQIVVVEGMLIGLIGTVFGTLLAVPIGKALTNVVGISVLDYPLPYRFGTVGVGLWLALSLVLAALSSFLPAFRAARISVRETLAYE
jgi:putative ABC transport system permease protein